MKKTHIDMSAGTAPLGNRDYHMEKKAKPQCVLHTGVFVGGELIFLGLCLGLISVWF